ncbi:MAG: Rrf2 family transcriptional regulator, partial [Mesorhizobium sp.]
MKRNSRLSSTLHILVHMAEKPEQALTSEQLATFIHTNPVVVRRTIAGLRDAGIVTSSRG